MLHTVFTRNKRWIFFTYLMLCVEFALFSILPHMLGKTIDALLAGSRQQFYMYLLASVAACIIGTARRRLDTRVFMQVWVDKSLDSIKDLLNRGIRKSFILSRVGLVGTYGNFFEFTIPSTFSAVIEILISFLMIWWVIPEMSYWLGALALLAIFSTYAFSFSIQRVERETQVLREETDARIVNDDFDQLEQDYNGLRDKYIQKSDLDAYCWRWVEVLSIIASVIAIFALVDSKQSAGTIMSSLMYTGKLFEKAGVLSFFFNHWKQIKMVDDVLRKP